MCDTPIVSIYILVWVRIRKAGKLSLYVFNPELKLELSFTEDKFKHCLLVSVEKKYMKRI